MPFSAIDLVERDRRLTTYANVADEVEDRDEGEFQLVCSDQLRRRSFGFSNSRHLVTQRPRGLALARENANAPVTNRPGCYRSRRSDRVVDA